MIIVIRLRRMLGEAVAFREETGRCTGGTLRGRGPGTHARIAEIISGRAIPKAP